MKYRSTGSLFFDQVLLVDGNLFEKIAKGNLVDTEHPPLPDVSSEDSSEKYGDSDSETLSFLSSDLRLSTALGHFEIFDTIVPDNRFSYTDSSMAEETPIAEDYLLWNNPEAPPPVTYKQESSRPFIVFMESTNQALNLGKLNPIALADLVNSIITGGKLIQRNGLNRVKITCDSWEDANALLLSKVLTDKNYNAYIPNSLKSVKGVVKDIDCSLSVKDIVGRMDPAGIEGLLSVKRRVSFDRHLLDSVEFVYSGTILPPNILISSFEFPMVLVVPRPIRCFKCQRYRHVATQCRSRYFRCEFCAGDHEAKDCENRQRRTVCCNCGESHPASSVTCSMYIKEQQIRLIRAEYGIGYQEAEVKFTEIFGRSLETNRTVDHSMVESSNETTMVDQRDDVAMDLSSTSGKSRDSNPELPNDQTRALVKRTERLVNPATTLTSVAINQPLHNPQDSRHPTTNPIIRQSSFHPMNQILPLASAFPSTSTLQVPTDTHSNEQHSIHPGNTSSPENQLTDPKRFCYDKETHLI